MTDVLQEALIHFGAGVGLTFFDYIGYRAANPKKNRIATKKACLNSIEYLLDANDIEKKTEKANKANGVQETAQATDKAATENKTVAPAPKLEQAFHYASNINVVKDYFTKTGIVNIEQPPMKRVKNFFYNVVHKERINNLPALTKFYVAAAGEAAYAALRISAEHWNAGAYLIPRTAGLSVGLITGNWLMKGFGKVTTWGEEKKLDHQINKMVKGTPLIDIVLAYQPSEEAKAQAQDDEKIGSPDVDLTKKGKKFYDKIGAKVESVMHFRENYKAKKQAEEEKQRKATKDRFDELTKDR